jgi:signal transduction histidine kinase
VTIPPPVPEMPPVPGPGIATPVLSDAERAVLAIVVHDLRTPLTSIVGFSEILVGRGGEMDPAMRHEALAAIRRAAAQAVALLDGLADLLTPGADT